MSDEQVEVEDFLVLGNAVPDEISDHRVTVCTAGYSPKYGLMRIYPVPPRSHMKRWNVVKVPLEKNSADTREESWKIPGSKSDWGLLPSKIELKYVVTDPGRRLAILDRLQSEFGVGCVEELNDRKASLGMIVPRIIECRMEKREDYEPNAQATLTSPVPFRTIKNGSSGFRVGNLLT